MAWDHHPGDDATVFLGEDLLAWLVLAIGAALAVGNALALIRPPETVSYTHLTLPTTHDV